MKSALIFITCLLSAYLGGSQSLQNSKKIIEDLCSSEFKGRGYVDNGVNKAANYLEAQFKNLKLKKFGKEYSQLYAFPVNTHPYPIQCKLDDINQEVGYQFLVDAGSQSISGKFNLLHFNMNDSLERILLYKKIEKGFEKEDALVMHHFGSKDHSIYDSCKQYQHYPSLFIRTEDKKLTHTISTETDVYPSLIFLDSVMMNKEQIEIEFKNEFINEFVCKNLIGYIKGKKSDSLIVYSAHYDHLGMLGTNAMFPGASDNASGVSMILYLAEYFSKNKPQYNTAFILFSGEEAGLIGSQYFTSFPTFDIKKIKMLINIDIMGNAEKGIVVVNGEVYKKQFDLLQSMNDSLKLLPQVRIRGKARNSDHYYFSEQGIPSIFIYSDGGVGYYHDVYDKANTIALTNYEAVAKLLIEFSKKL